MWKKGGPGLVVAFSLFFSFLCGSTDTGEVIGAPEVRPPLPVSTPACRVGDFNCDGVIDAVDFVIFKRSYGCAEWYPCFDVRCDINYDNFVNTLDFVLFKRAFGG